MEPATKKMKQETRNKMFQKMKQDDSAESAHEEDVDDCVDEDSALGELVDDCVVEAKKLKHEADKETDKETKIMKYLDVIMMFITSGIRPEASGLDALALARYKQALRLVKTVMSLIKYRKKALDTRLVVMAMRAQALLNLRLHKMRQRELKDIQGAIQAVLDATKGKGKGKGKTHVTFPKSLIQDQLDLSSHLGLALKLWDQAEHAVRRCREFCLQVDGECGALTLTSGLEELVAHTRRGLAIVEGVGGQRASRKVKEDNQTREGIKEEDTEDKESLSVDSKMKMEYIEMDDVKQENLDPSNAQGCMNANSVFKK